MTETPPLDRDDQPAARDVRAWWSLAAIAALLRMLLMPHGGFPTDIGTFKAWATSLAEHGPAAFYGAGFADYLPGYLYVLWVIGEINRAVRFNDPAFLFALKAPAVAADLVTAWILFGYGRNLGSTRALLVSASYLFNPGVIFNSAIWGQADAVGAALALAGVTLAGAGAPWLVAGLLAAAALIKPQTAPVILPVGVFLLHSLSRPASGPPRWDRLAGAAGAATVLLAAAVAPFRLTPAGLVDVMTKSLDVYPYGSVVAFNIWGAVQGFWVSDGTRWLGVPLYALGAGATLVVLAAMGVWTWRHPHPGAVVLAGAAVLITAFILPTRIHERYLLPAIPFLAAVAVRDRRALWLYAGASTVFAANLLFAYTRPYAQTFLLPGWLEATVFSAYGARVWSALGVMALPAVLWLLRAYPRTPPGTLAGSAEPADAEPQPDQFVEGPQQHAG
jgi:Gpi18-like mannosyltransferase